MSLFNKHHKEKITEYKFPIPERRMLREEFFCSLDALTSQAEFHFNNKNFELSEGIFELMIKHIEKHKTIRFSDNSDTLLEHLISKTDKLNTEL